MIARILGKAIGIAILIITNYAFWCFVEQSIETEHWSGLARFLYMTANVFILYRTIIYNNDEY